MVTLLRSSIRNNTFFTGTPLRCIPACILSSLRDYFCLVSQDILSYFAGHFGRRLGRVRVNFLFHKELFLAMAEPKQA